MRSFMKIISSRNGELILSFTKICKSYPSSRGARDSKIRKKWPESSRILDYILS